MAAMARIVITQYRYKRPPKKRKPVTLTGAAIVTVKRARGERNKPKPPPANDDEKPAPKQPAIVTTRPRRGRFGDVEDLTPEEHRRRGDAAEALWRELVRRATSEP